MKRLIEIRSYALKAGTAEAFTETFVTRALPMLREAGIDVVAFGKSMHDPNAWYLIRAFDDFADLNAREDAFTVRPRGARDRAKRSSGRSIALSIRCYGCPTNRSTICGG